VKYGNCPTSLFGRQPSFLLAKNYCRNVQISIWRDLCMSSFDLNAYSFVVILWSTNFDTVHTHSWCGKSLSWYIFVIAAFHGNCQERPQNADSKTVEVFANDFNCDILYTMRPVLCLNSLKKQLVHIKMYNKRDSSYIFTYLRCSIKVCTDDPRMSR